MLNKVCSSGNMESPLVSVLVPVYNGEKYLPACLDSILSQTMEDMEVICIDDCSTDSSLSILREYAMRDQRVRLYQSEVNSGVDIVMNQALELVRGRYVQSVGQDDLLEEEMLDILVREAEWFDLDFVMFDHKVLYESQDLQERFCQGDRPFRNYEGKIWSGPELYTAMMQAQDYHPECGFELWRYDYLQKHGIRFGEGMDRPFGDHIFFFHAMLCAKRIKYIPKQLYIYRRHKGATTLMVRENTKKAMWKDFRSIFSVACDRMRLMGEQECLPDNLVEVYVRSEMMRWLPRIEEWYRALGEPERVPFRNPMHAYCYQLFREKMAKEMKFKTLVRIMKEKRILLLGDVSMRTAACALLDIPETNYAVIADAPDRNWAKMAGNGTALVFFTSMYPSCKECLEGEFSMTENVDFMDGRALLW
ncbi:MAG: glycosyltransferase [Selenomonadaceae bacterium]|nr:glycosyltransferase [Selenomonadaceae bacterium]